MLIRNHEVFVIPKLAQTLWRYMDFTKLVSLLESSSLVFPRVDQFDDPYEAHLTEAAVHELRTGKINIPQTQVEQWVRFPEQLRKRLFVSCWCAGEHESAGMWRLYLSSTDGVAVRTNTSLLADVLDESPFTIGMSAIKYVDYAKTTIPFQNALYPVMHKRLSFSHEQEFRAVIWADIPGNDEVVGKDDVVVPVQVSLSRLVQAIHVSPTSPIWFGELVEQVARRYSLNVPVVRSNLYERPVY